MVSFTREGRNVGNLSYREVAVFCMQLTLVAQSLDGHYLLTICLGGCQITAKRDLLIAKYYPHVKLYKKFHLS